MPKVSVIIPVYNAAEFLRSSLDSVLCQTIGDLEVLCTDDGSNDESLDILREYAEKDPRVRVFCQENKGAGPARNMGLANAQGEYVVFMDGDDGYPENDTLERLYQAAQEHDSAIVAGYRSMLTDKGIHADIHDPLYKLAQEHTEGVMLHYRDVQYDFNYQCYCFRRSLLVEHDITFPDYRRCQDPPFLVKAMIAADQFFLLPIASYLYRWGHQNIKWNKRKINDLMKAHVDLLRMSRDAELERLHGSVASRVERKYKGIILSCLNRENLELYALFAYANSITDYEWLRTKGITTRKDNKFESAAEMASKLANVITISGAMEQDAVRSCVEEIYGFYSELDGSDERALNNVMLCLLAQLYNGGRPFYIRKQLADFVVSARYTRISTNCDSTQKEVAEAKETLNGILVGFGYYSRLQSLRDEQTHHCRCIFDSRTGSKPLVSVIVPIFNVERYIGECLESLVSQTCKEIEVICVNDGSTDSSLDIVMKYARNNPNFVVLQQYNCGLSVARNSGLKFARGEYVHFLDSDDFMVSTSYEQLLDKALANHLDMLFFDGESYYEDEVLRREYPWYESGYTSSAVGDSITDGHTYFITAVVEKDFRVSACMYLIRRDFLEQHQIRFLEGIVHEDNYFTYVCALLSERTSHLTAALYQRRVCRGSITIREKKFRHGYGYFASYMALRKFLDHVSLPQGLKDVASLKLMDMLKNARNEYGKIVDKQDLQYYLALPAVESEQFYLMVVDPVQQMKASEKRGVARRNAKPQQNVSNHAGGTVKKPGLARRVLQCCKDHGIFYTISHAVKKFGRKIGGGIQCCKDHGLFYTIKHIFSKIFR